MCKNTVTLAMKPSDNAMIYRAVLLPEVVFHIRLPPSPKLGAGRGRGGTSTVDPGPPISAAPTSTSRGPRSPSTWTGEAQLGVLDNAEQCSYGIAGGPA